MLARRRTPRPFDFRRRLRRCELVEQVGRVGVANCAAHAPRAGSSAPLRRSSFASVSAGIITSSNVAATPCAET